MIRYQIRNEYGLSDPELYAAPGEEDDPEALLEGVAMAGLVGVLRQLGDLAEFAAEIFHDLHEDVMATASRGHGLMLRLQQLEAEFPAAEKAIISQTDHSNYPHDEGLEWHPNLQFKQNMITQGDMPRFILDTYEECRGPPRLFTLDKFDVAGAGASLKRYSDPSFFKIEHASNMIESDDIMEKKPRRIKKKAMRWRKGVTLEALLVANSETKTTSKDRASRKVPPRTTKLKSRRPRSPDYKTISRICREHLQEVISSQQKIMSSYSARHYHVKFGSTGSSETTSPLGELNNFGARQSTGKLELSKVVPINESDAVDTTSAPNSKQFFGKQHEPTELKDVSKMSPVEQNGMICDSENLQDCPDLLVGEKKHSLQSAHEGKLLLAASRAEQDADGCRSDDIASDQDNFVDAPNSMDSEGVIDPEMKVDHDPSTTVEGNEFNHGSKEGEEDASEAKFLEVDHIIEPSAGLNVSCNVEEPTCLDLPLINDSAPSTVATTNGPNSSPSGRQLNGVDGPNDEEPFCDEDLMDVSSSSSVVSDNADQEAIDDSVGRQQYLDGAYQSLNAAVVHNLGQSPKTSGDLDGLAVSSNDCADNCHSVNHGENFVLDGSSMSTGGTNDVSEDEEEINVGVPDENVVSPSPAGLDPDDTHKHLDGIAVKHPNMRNNLLYESNDDEVVEDVLSLPDDDLSTPFNMHVAEDHQVVVLDEGACSDSLDTQKEDSVQSSAMAKDFAYAQELPGVIQGESPSRYDTEVYEGETLESSSYVFNDDTEPLNIGQPRASSTSSLRETTSPCVEQLELTEMEDTREFGKVAATEKSTIRRFADGVLPPEEHTDAAKYEGETPAPSSSVFNDDTEPLNIGEPLAPSTSSLRETTSLCVEQLELTEMEDTRKCGKVVDTEESTITRFADGVPPPEEDTDAAKYERETPASSSCVFNDDTEPLNISVPLAPSTSSLRETTNACVEHALTEMEYKLDCGKAVVTEESTNSSFADGVVPTEEITDAAENSDRAEVLATDEDSRHDMQLPSSYPFREELETVEASCRTLGVLDESRECISKISMVQTGSTPFNEIETTSGKCSDDDAVHFLSSVHFPEESHCEEQLLEEASFSAEVLPGCNLDKDGAVSPKNNAVEKQPANVDQDLVWVVSQDSSSNTVNKQRTNEDQDFKWDLSAQDSSSTNPFMDPAYMTSHAQIYPSSSMSYPPCISEEQDFLSELLTEHDNMGAGTDSLWEPATPPNEAPLPSEVMAEEDFRSFCDEYHEMNFIADTDGCYGEPASDSSNISNASLVSESDWACSVSAQAVKLDQEGSSGFHFTSQRAECSSIMDTHADTSIPFSVKKHLEDETPEVASHLNSRDSFSDNRSPELDTLSVPMGLQEQQHNPCGVDSHSSSHLFDNEKTDEECCSPSSKVVAVKEELEVNANLVSHSFTDENLDELDVSLSNALPVELEAGAHVLDEHNNKDGPFCVFSEFDSRNNPPSTMDDDKDNPEASVLRTFQAEQSSECFPSDDHDTQTALSSSLDEKVDELDGHPLSNAVLLDEVPEICVPCGLDSGIIPGSTDEKIYGHDRAPLSSSVLVEFESEDHVLSDRDSQVTPCYFVKDKIDESEAAQQNSVLSQEQEKDVHASPVLDSPPVSLNIDKVVEMDGPPSCNVQVESDCPTEFDSQTAPCSLSSDALVDRTALTSTPVMPSTEKTCQLSLDPPSNVPFQNDSFEDLQKPPPLPPLQWRLGRPRLGLINTKGGMPESAGRTYPILQASNQDMDTGLGLLDRTNRSVEPVPSQGLKEDTDKSSMIDGSDQNIEFRSLSTSVAETGIARQFSEASDNIKQQEHMSSSAIRIDEHPDDNTGISKTRVEEHLDNSDVTHGTALYPTIDPLLLSPTYEQPDPHVHILSSVTSEKSEHPIPIHTHPDDQNAAVDMVSTSTEGHISASRCYQQVEHRELLSENLEHNEHSEDSSVKHLSFNGEAPSDTATPSAPDLPLDEQNSQESQTSQEQNLESSEDSQLGGSLPSAESMATQDCPNDRHNLEREKINQPSGPSLGVSGLDEGSYAHAEQPPVMGWTVGPQMLHPNYGVLIEERPYMPNISDNHLIRKPISIKNIPRNPLVDAVAAHDRSSMRKVSELPPPVDKPKPNERNLLLEQIRNKTFNLKPASSMPIAIRSPARADTRNLKVAAIIEKANAIRQAVGSDDEDGDNWSD